MGIPVSPLAEFDRFDKPDHLGHQVAFVGARGEQVSTAYGDADAAHCEAVICATCVRGWTDQLVFGTAIVPRICTGDPITGGILVQGKAQPGRQPPWLLDEFDAAELAEVQALTDRVVTRLGSGKLVVDVDALRPSDPPETEERF